MRLGLCAVALLSWTALSPAGSVTLAPAPVVTETRDGLWIWTRSDSSALHRGHEDVLPGVLVATLVAEGSRIRWRRGLSPSVVSGPVSLVVRLDDSLHDAFRERDARQLAHDIDTQLGQLLTEVRATGARFDEVQLDYDAPVLALAAWADVVRALGRGSLRGLRIWVTSIPAHLGEPAHEALFAGAIEGHELQLFDTGLDCNPRELGRLRERLSRSSLPFRVGVGAFERRGRRDHACWARQARSLSELPGYAGTWIFPAGNPDALALRSDP